MPLVVVAAMVAAIAWSRWDAARARAETSSPDAVAAEVIAGYSRGLPKPFGPGVTIERVALEGRDVVMTLRVDKPGIAEALADPAMRERVVLAEHAQLLPLCDQRQPLYLLSRGYTVTRRFVGPDGADYFKATLTGTHCLRAQELRRRAGERK